VINSVNLAQHRAMLLELNCVELRSVLSIQNNFSFDDSAGVIDDAQDRLRGHAFSAAALADDAELLSRQDVEGRAVDGFGRSLVLEETRVEVLHRKERLLCVLHERSRGSYKYGSAASLMPSPMKLNARTATMTAKDGIRSHGEITNAWMFCASWSRTPQLIAGGRKPSPRKLNDVSL